MVIVTKKIGGIDYLYEQHSYRDKVTGKVKTDGKYIAPANGYVGSSKDKNTLAMAKAKGFKGDEVGAAEIFLERPHTKELEYKDFTPTQKKGSKMFSSMSLDEMRKIQDKFVLERNKSATNVMNKGEFYDFVANRENNKKFTIAYYQKGDKPSQMDADEFTFEEIEAGSEKEARQKFKKSADSKYKIYDVSENEN